MELTRQQMFAIGAVVVVALVGLGVVAFSLSRDDDQAVSSGDASTTTTAAETTTSSSSSTTSTTDEAGQVAVRTYFARDEGVATAGRQVTPPAVARGAMESLLAGPDELEVLAGMGTEIPQGTELLGLAVADGEATVDLSSDLEAGGGSLSMQMRVAQVVFTLTQFDSVDQVDVRLDGEAVDAIGGEGVPARDLTRADFAEVTPAILVESPYPGEQVTLPVAASGISNTFEANVQYELTGPDGGVLDQGFTTATAGNGTWGDFAFEATGSAASGDVLLLTVFQEDAADGSRRDVYEVPVRLR